MIIFRTYDITTDAGGDATVVDNSYMGVLYSIKTIAGTLDAGATFTIYSGLGIYQSQIFQQTGITDEVIYPRATEADAVDGSGLATTTMPMVSGNITVVVEDGGNVGSGTIQLMILEDVSATLRILTQDTARPMVEITSAENDPTANSPFEVTVTFSESVTGFVVGDVVVGNGTAGNFTAVSASEYTVDITPTGAGEVTVDVAADVATDAGGNGNFVATQFSITYTP